jgi:hypothetical protein
MTTVPEAACAVGVSAAFGKENGIHCSYGEIIGGGVPEYLMMELLPLLFTAGPASEAALA